MDFYQQLCEIVGESQVRSQEPMKKHTTFRVGGPADYFVTPTTAEQTGKVIRVCREMGISFFILGNGSNLLVADSGYRGVVLYLGKTWSEVRRQDNMVWAGAGISLAKLADCLADYSLAGFEFAAGIPGSLGGATAMNAGAYGGDMAGVLHQAKIIDCEGNLKLLSKDEMELGYRTSRILRNQEVVLEVCLELETGSEEEIRERIKDFNGRRRVKQPLEYPSAGSTFKRPEGYFAGKLIQDSGLSGLSEGGARVSEKHCGFIINTGSATAQDILTLYDEVRRRVREKFGILLELEVELLGDF